MSIDVSTLSIEARSTGIKETADGLNKIFLEAGKAERRTTALTASIDKLSNAFNTGTASARAYQQAVQLSNATVGGSSAAQTALTVAIKQLNTSITVLVAGLGNVTVQAKNSANAINFHTNAMKDAHAAARGLSGALGALWVTYGNMIPLAAGLAIGAGFKQIVSVGKDVENTLEGIRVKGQESIASINAMRDAVLDIGKGIYGPREVAKAFETLILAGKSAKEAMTGIKDALNLATVGGTTIEKSAYTLVQVTTSLGMTANGFGRVADVIAMTAAVSMSSVESISEAFKSGSAVGKLYGATLVDIGTAFAALSNLGIQGSAAGTSLKNFYKELSSEGKKVTQTLADVGISVNKSLKDSEGNFKPLAELLPILSEGLDKLTVADQKLALARLSNERGLKTIVELLSLYRQKGEDAASAFADMQKKIDESYGYTAIGAAAMSLTVENQMKSVANTLQTTFVKAFEDIQPQLSVMTTRLKALFSSPEFISGVGQIALALANMAVWVTENIGLIGTLLKIFLEYKAIAFVAGLLVSIAEGFVVLKTAMDLAKFSALAMNLAFGAVGAILLVVGGAITYYLSKKSEISQSAESKAALTYIDNFTESLREEGNRLEEQIRLMKEGKTASDAYTESLRNRQLEMVKVQGQKLIDEKQKDVDRLKGELSPSELRSLDRAHKLGATSIQMLGSVNAVLAAERAVVDAQNQSNQKYKEAEEQVARVVERSKERAKLAEEEARRNNKVTGGEDHVTPLGNTGDKLSGIQNEIIQLARLKAAYKSKAETVVASGMEEVKQIGDVHQAQTLAALQEGKYANAKEAHLRAALMQAALEADTAKFELDKAQALEDMQGKMTRKMNVEKELLDEANSGHSKLTGTYEAEAKELLRLWQIETASDRGAKLLNDAKAVDQYVAAKEKAVKINKLAETMTNEAIGLGEQAEALRLYGLSGKQTALQLAEAKIKISGLNETMAEGAINALRAAAAFKDLETANRDLRKMSAELADQNLKDEAEMVAAVLNSEAEKVMAKRETTRKAIEFSMQQAEAAYKAAQTLGGITPEQEAAYQAAMSARTAAMEQLDKSTAMGLSRAAVTDMNTLLEQSKTLASDLEGAFGSVGKAIGGMVTALTAYAKSQATLQAQMALAKETKKTDPVKAAKIEQEATRASAQAQIKSYADMAGAAKGFFDENSKGYEVMHAVEQTFRAFELAAAMESFLEKSGLLSAFTSLFVTAKATETAAEVTSVGTTVAAEGAKQTAFGTTGLAAALSLPFPANIPAFAIVAAMLAAIGVAVSGSSASGRTDIAKERQASQSTGTVLGDENAKSESISKTLEIMKNNSDIALSYSSSMLQTLRSIRDGISNMASMIIQTSGLRGTASDEAALGIGTTKNGGAIGNFLSNLPVIGSLFGGLFGSSTTTLVDSGILFATLKTTLQKVVTTFRGGSEDIEHTVESFREVTQRSSQTVGDILDSRTVGMQGFTQTRTKKSSFFGLFNSTRNNEQLSALPEKVKQQFASSVSSVFSGILASTKMLGANTDAAAEAMRKIDIADAMGLKDGKLSLKGLSGTDAEKALEAAFSALSDTMAQSIVPEITQFAKVGEGAFQTLVRVANGVDVADYALEKIGITAINYTNVLNKQGDVAAEIVRDSILAKEKSSVLSGVADNVSTGIAKIIDTLDGTAQDIADTYADLIRVRDLLTANGINGNNLSRDTIRGAGGLDALKTGVQDFFSNFFTEAEQNSVKMSLLRKEFTALGISMPQTKEQFKALVQASDNGTDAGNRLVGKLLTLAGAFAEVTDAADKVGNSLKDAADKALKDAAQELLDNVDKAFAALQRSVDAEKKRITELYDAEIKAVRKKAEDDIKVQKDKLKVAEEAQKAISSVFDSLKNALKSTAVESAALLDARRKEAQALLKSADVFAKGGGSLVGFAGLDDALATLAKPSEQLFATFEDYARDQAMTRNSINDLISDAQSQKDIGQLTIDAINGTIDTIQITSTNQIAVLEATRDAELARLDKIVEDAQAQIDALHGVDNSIKSLTDAINSFNSAVSAAKANPVVAAPSAITQAYQDNLHRAPETAGFNFWNNKVASGTPISEVVAGIANSNEAKVQELYSSILGRTGEAAGVGFWQQKLDSGVSIEEVKKGFYGSDEYKASHPSFDVGTNYVPEDMLANIHEGERIIPAADNAELMNRMRNPQQADEAADRAQLLAAIQDLKQCIVSGDVANVQQVKEIVKVVRKWDGEGMPDTRTT